MTLTVAAWSNFDFVKTAATAFEKTHPNVSIKINAIPGDDYFSSLPRTFGTGSGADVTVLEVGSTGSYPALVKQGSLADLSDVWQSQGLAAATPESVTKAYTSDGKQYAVNIDETYLPVVYYNKDLFKKLGLTAPDSSRVASMDDFFKITDALKADGELPLAYAWKTDAHHIFQQNLLSTCGDDKYLALAASSNQGATATASWTDPCVVSAIQAFKTMADKGVFGKDPIIDGDVAGASFLSAKAGMMLSGTWQVSTLQQQAKFGWGWFLLPPAGSNPTKWLLYPGDGIGVNAKSKNVDVAKEFVASMMTKDFQSSLLSAGRPPSRTDVTAPANAIPELVAIQKSIQTLGSQTHLIGILAPPDLQDTVVSDSQQVIQGSLSPQDMAQQLEDEAQQLRSGS